MPWQTEDPALTPADSTAVEVTRATPLDYTASLPTTLPAAPPSEWKCPAASYNDGVCDCGCSAPDPDCSVVTRPVRNCAADEARRACSRRNGAGFPQYAERDEWAGDTVRDVEQRC